MIIHFIDTRYREKKLLKVVYNFDTDFIRIL